MRTIKFLTGLVISLFTITAVAQSPDVDVFRSNQPLEPEVYGNGALYHIIQGDNLLRRGKFEESILEYGNALVVDPYFAEGYIKRALAKFRLGWMNEAQKDYQKASKINPYAADLYGYSGNTGRLRLLAFDTARLTADRMDEGTGSGRSPEYRALLSQIIDLKTKGAVLSALNVVNDLIEPGRTSDPRLFKLRGNLHLLLDNFTQAIEDYDRAIRMDGTFEEAYFNRGLANLLSNNRPDACYDMETSVRLGYRKGVEKMQYFCGL